MGRAQLGRLAVVIVGVALGASVAATPAFAHGQLVYSDPVDGATIAQPRESVSLYFTEKPAPFAYFTITAPSGRRVDGRWSHGEPIRLDEPVREYQLINGVWEPQLYHTGFPAKIPVAYWPEQGLYVARYQSVASDGEEVQGEVGFSFTGAITAAPPGWQEPTDGPSPELLAAVGQNRPTGVATPPPAGSGAAPSTGRGGGIGVWLLPVLLVAGTTVLIYRVARRPAGPPHRTSTARATGQSKARSKAKSLSQRR